VVHDALHKDIEDYLWFGVHDNINLAFKVCKQYLNNKSHFDSGTASMIIVLKDPACVTLDAQSYCHQSAAGARNPITYMDILKLEVKAAPHLKILTVYHILQCLMSAAQFNFKTYKYKDHEMFNCPSVTDRFRGGSGNTNYLVEDERDLRGRFVQSNRGMVRTRLILTYIVSK
jgi:hypothetical protein